jgi:ArsR family transcriptional regulator
MKDISKLFKVLSDESRLRVLNLLLERECCVCEVMQALDISQSKASRTLNALYDVGILKLHKEGLWSLYSIDWEGMGTDLKAIIEATTRSLEVNEVIVTDRERLRKAERVGPGCVQKIRSEKAASDFQT